jgi:Gpi18-like mannosyltransferase
MNNQVAWDSEYYLSIAVAGYEDPRAPHYTPAGITMNNPPQPAQSFSTSISVNYAFFPFYSVLIRMFSFPLRIFGLTSIATATLAGVIVSALGALLGMLALYDLAHEKLGEDGALRAVFYLMVFPTGFFLLQVYTEGLFVGLAFACLAMLKRKNWLAAALFGVCATLTRAVGVALIVPMMIAWIRTGEWMDLDLEWHQIIQQGSRLRPLGRFLLVLTPLITFLIWKFSYLGLAFDYIESKYYGRGYLSLNKSVYEWSQAFHTMLQGTEPQHTAYYLTEFLGFALAVVACILCVKLDPELGWFSVAVVLISWGSGPAQGIHRYILGAPAVFLILAHWGRNTVFDRAWTLLSILLMGALAMLFAFDMWVA